MTKKTTLQYGTWPSPISPRVVSEALRLNNVLWYEDILVWSEGRGLLFAQSGIDAPVALNHDANPARGRVGYGGGGFTVGDGSVYFAGHGGRLYRVPVTGGKPKPLTPAFGGMASPTVSSDGAWVAYVHTYEEQDTLGVVDATGQHWPGKLFSGTDFVMQPDWHPAGTHIAFVTWDHPQMPWDGTHLHLVRLRYETLPAIEDDQIITGDEHTAIFQPTFSPDGRWLAYVSDATGHGQLYLYDLDAETHHQITEAKAEHGMPAWVQGMRTYAWADADTLVFLRNHKGRHTAHRYTVSNGEETPVSGLDDYTHCEQITANAAGQVALIASAPQISPRVVSMDGGDVRVHRRSTREHLKPAQLADGEAIEWQGEDGDTVHGIYYPPTSDRTTGTGKPPLIVVVHGGPTSQAFLKYDMEAQFFATRGYAVLYVNHRGGTGYGRDYMQQLRGAWGHIDVVDSASGAQHLVEAGKADPERLIIMGGSAGGYTVLQSLVEKPGFYAAGICRYGIANQFMLVQDTHKFESRYSESLLGTLPAATQLYRDRSPLFHADKISDPVIIFQGEDDQIVPPNQSEAIVKALRSRGVPHEYHLYPGEGHGFRKPETKQHYYTQIVAFLNQYVIYQ